MALRCVLGIESSCDDTAVAIYESTQGIVAHQHHSQIKTHTPYQGVVPELASRDHIKKTLPLVRAALAQADLVPSDIDGIAYTAGPGLIGALMVGAGFAKSLGYAWGVPTIGVHHMEAHLMAALLESPAPEPPFVALLVSGGHTMLVCVNAIGVYEVLGETRDDAAGEAFDKLAKLMGLGMPGGPLVSALAEVACDRDRLLPFPRPMLHNGLDFSFSGLKTHAAQVYADSAQDDESKAGIAAAFEEAVVETLCVKSCRALEQTGLSDLVVVGGVSANKKLRMQLRECLGVAHVFYPRFEYCTDNGAMVAYAGYCRLKLGERDPDLVIQAKARWPLADRHAD